MRSDVKCVRCGTPMAVDGPEGHCAVCLMSLAMGERGDAGRGESAGGDERALPAGFGSRYFGDYEVIEEIARGAMGVVYRARQLSLNRPVALKISLEGSLANSTLRERFRVEAHAAATLHHPNIVPIHEVGEYRGRHFLSMELIEGGNLGERLGDFALPPREEAYPSAGGVGIRRQRQQRHHDLAALMATVARAIHHAHQRGILHRDLKPANILIDRDGQPHVADFGLAKLLEQESYLTHSGAVLGTPAYMAPEQAAGESDRFTTAGDVYSLGAVLYHLLAGKPPFQAPTPLETLRLVVESDPVPPDRVNPAADHDLSTICLKCLEKDPNRRYPSAQALAEDLGRWQSGQTIFARPATRAERFARWCRRNRAVASLIGVVVLLLLTVALVATLSAFRLDRARQRAVAAEQAATEKLRESYLAQARALRWSGKAGRRFDALCAISNAAAIWPSLELRNEAIACLALEDLRPVTGVPVAKPGERVLLDLAHERYAVLGTNRALSLRSWADQAEVRQFPAQDQAVLYGGDFSRDGRWLSVLYADGVARVWDLQLGDLVCERADVLAAPLSAKPGDGFGVMAFSPDGSRWAVGVKPRQLAVVDLNDPAEERRQELPLEPRLIRWNPSGTMIACAGGQRVIVLDATTGAKAAEFVLPNRIATLAWHPDGAHLLVAEGALPGGCSIHVLNPQSGTRDLLMAGSHAEATSLAFSPDGGLLAVSGGSGWLRLFAFASGSELVSAPAGWGLVEFSADGRRLGVCSDAFSRVECFEVGRNKVSAPLRNGTNAMAEGATADVLFGPSGRWVEAKVDGALALWEPWSAKPLLRVPDWPFEKLVMPGKDFGLFGWSRRGFYRLPWAASGEDAAIGSPQPLAFTVPPALETACPPGGLQHLLPSGVPGQMACAPDGRTVAIVSDRCYILNVAAGTLQAVTDSTSRMKYVAVSPDGRWVATGGAYYPSVDVWEAVTGRRVARLAVGDTANVEFSPDGRWLVSGTAAEYRFWRLGDWTPAHRVGRVGVERRPGTMAFSHDGKLLALTHNRSVVHLVSPETGATLAQIDPSSDDETLALAFNGDASELALARMRSCPQIWHLTAIRKQLTLSGLDW